MPGCGPWCVSVLQGLPMTQHQPSPLLTKAPPGRHFAQLHRSERSLGEAVGTFLGAGLRRGEGVLVLATADHVRLFFELLTDAGLDPGAEMGTGSLLVLDAQDALERIVGDGEPNWSEFRTTVTAALDTLESRGYRNVRIYGELVDVLWHDGRTAAAIRLEEFWNSLAGEREFSLFCCYTLDGLAEDVYSSPLHEIGRTHSDILAGVEDERFHAAVDAASRDMFGSSLSKLLSASGHEDHPGEHKLPLGQRTMLWIKRHMPTSCATVLGRARSYYDESHEDVVA